jgi:hypothetical protein
MVWSADQCTEACAGALLGKRKPSSKNSPRPSRRGLDNPGGDFRIVTGRALQARGGFSRAATLEKPASARPRWRAFRFSGLLGLLGGFRSLPARRALWLCPIGREQVDPARLVPSGGAGRERQAARSPLAAFPASAVAERLSAKGRRDPQNSTSGGERGDCKGTIRLACPRDTRPAACLTPAGKHSPDLRRTINFHSQKRDGLLDSPNGFSECVREVSRQGGGITRSSENGPLGRFEALYFHEDTIRF